MASSRKLMKLVFMVSLLAVLLMSGTLEAARSSNGTSPDGTNGNLHSSGASRPAPAPRGRSLASQSVFSVDRYGARGDGIHDDTRALKTAWNAACASPQPAVVFVPDGRHYLLKLVTLQGPCKSSVTLTVKGTLAASPNRADWSDRDGRHWIVFRSVNKLTVALCLRNLETISHMMQECPYSKQVWTLVSSWTATEAINPENWPTSEDFSSWYINTATCGQGIRRKGIQTIVMLTTWAIWKERNGRVFNRNSRTPEQLLTEIKDEASLWVSAGNTALSAAMPLLIGAVNTAGEPPGV